jgi:RHS repeat-associated protein
VYVLPDHLGPVRQLVGSDGQVDLAQSFDPFGVPFEASGSGTSDFGYTGEWWGSYNELLYLRARWYAPEIGRFISQDRVENEPLYLYARGNPVNLIDPDGMMPRPYNSCQTCSPNSPKSKFNNGYSESVVTSITLLRPRWVLQGTEAVFDFATMEIGEFGITFENTSESDTSSLQFDIGLVSAGRVYQWSLISGFDAEPEGRLQRDYGPAVVNFSLGLSLGSLISVKAGYQSWLAEDFSLSGAGLWYGAEAAGLDWASLAIPGITEITALTGVPLNVSYYKSSTIYRYTEDFGDVCNPEEAHRFLAALEDWPYPLNYAGLYIGRLMAIQKFKDYAGID